MNAHLRLQFAVAVALVLLLGLVSCSGGGQRSHFPTGETVVATVSTDLETVLALPSGSSVTFPAGAFAATTQVTVSEMLGGEERDAAGFPEGSGSLVAALSITATPGSTLLKDLTVALALDNVRVAGEQFVVYQFNPEHHLWESTESAASSWHGTSAIAQVGATGSMATFTADTTGLASPEVTYGIFENLHP